MARPSPLSFAKGQDVGARFAAGDDGDLVARASSGDREAEETIYRRHVQYVGGMIMRMLGSPVDVEDVIQDTFIIAFAQLRYLRDPRALRPWLAQIGVSQVRRRFRRRRLLRMLGLDTSPDTATLEAIAAPEAAPDVRSELAALGRILSTLPTNQRIAWSLRYIEGAALEEVARACDCSLATAKRRVAAAHARVRAVVDAEVVAVPLRKTRTPPADPKVKS